MCTRLIPRGRAESTSHTVLCSTEYSSGKLTDSTETVTLIHSSTSIAQLPRVERRRRDGLDKLCARPVVARHPGMGTKTITKHYVEDHIYDLELESNRKYLVKD